jgi:flavodoxin
MKTLIVYFSKFGNTRRVAEAVAETLAPAGDARAISVGQLTVSDLQKVDLVVMGSPTHYQNLPKAVRPIFETLPRKILVGKSVAAFDTSRETWGPIMRLTVAHKLLSKLRRLGGKRVVPPETFLVKAGDSDRDGEIDLLYDGEIERAKEWAATILKWLEPQMQPGSERE